MEKLKIIKIGGKVIDNPELLKSFLQDFAGISGKKILVHGGGKIASTFSAKMGIEPNMVNGRRVTDAETLEIVLMVYGGLINKKMVADLQSLDCNALGLTGADLNILKAYKRPPEPVDYGFVGEIEQVNHTMLKMLLENGVVPVLAPLSHDKKGQMFNTNADTIAAGAAVGLSCEYDVDLYYCFEKQGVLGDPADDDSVIEKIAFREFADLQKSGVISEGMIPKLENSFECIQKGVKQVIICHFGAIRNLENPDFKGTLLIDD
ncbi:MAG: acetylglutamate kinase [Candidatus Cyclobacteriaceae bacterium M3_2C_046]